MFDLSKLTDDLMKSIRNWQSQPEPSFRNLSAVLELIVSVHNNNHGTHYHLLATHGIYDLRDGDVSLWWHDVTE